MTVDQITYLTFGIVLLGALALDLGLMSKKKCLYQHEKGHVANHFLGWAFCSVLYFFMV